jgi:hypothetical protein
MLKVCLLPNRAKLRKRFILSAADAQRLLFFLACSELVVSSFALFLRASRRSASFNECYNLMYNIPEQLELGRRLTQFVDQILHSRLTLL